tara:strand:+ start:513 stop:2705 length:2193 start_codon:yes stop_codon:yes gene_type:complete
MAMENLLRIANRTEDLPDQALAQLAKAGGIEGVIAASEMKARSDIRKDAQMPQQGQMPPVVDQLINMANRQAAPQMPPMGQPMPPQAPQAAPMAQGAAAGRQALMARGAPTAPSAPMPQGISPELAALAARGGIPAMQGGGLIRRFQAGSQGTIGLQLLEEEGYTPDTFALLSDVEQQDVLQAINDRRAINRGASALLGSPVGAATDAVMFAPRLLGNVAQDLMSGRTGRALGFADPGDQPNLTPYSASQQKAVDYRATQQPITMQQLSSPTMQNYASSILANTAAAASQPSSQTTTTKPSAPSSGQAYINAVSGPINNQQITPQMYMNAISGPQGGQSGTQADTFTSPDVAIAGATQPFNALYNPISNVVPYEQSPQYAKDAALLRQMQSSQVTVNGLQGDLLATLQEREKKYNKEVDDSVQRLADLEKDLPTRQNIKDRLKKQTSLGMAQAFFQAAGSKSPDFITAMSQGLAGAAGVMNKMTGEEQKELYAHALAEYQREQGKANTAFKRQENAMKKITDAQTFQATIASANRTARNQVAKMQQDGYYDAMRINVDVDKANQADVLARHNISREEYNDFRDDVRTATKNRDDFGIAANKVDQDSKIKPEQRVLANDIGNSYANQYVRGAQANINKGLKRVISDLNKEYNKLAKQIPDPQERMAAARAALEAKHQREGAIGDMAVLDEYAEDLFDLATAKDKDAAYKRFYQRPKNSFLNPKILAYNLTP